MKNIIALTALAAAASAQTAPASGINHNTLTFGRSQRDNSVSAQIVLGQSNFVAGFATANGDQTDSNYGELSVGYIFRNVTQNIDAVVSVLQTNGNDTVYTAEVRRELSEIYQGLEFRAGYASTCASGTTADFTFGGYAADSAESSYYVGLSYNINKTFAVGVSLNKATDYDRATVWSVRASF